MTVDYDVVIIGGTPAGRYAALTAAQLHATVALVEPTLGYGFIYHQALSQIGQLAQQLGGAAPLGIHSFCADTQDKCYISVKWAQAREWANAIVTNLEEQHSPAILAAAGVDVIVGSGEFQSSPHLAFAVNERQLRSRTYLIATGSVSAIPDIPGLATTGYVSLSDIWQCLSKSQLPNNLIILGGTPESIPLAQTLRRFGCSVTLVVETPNILLHIDPDIAQLLQAQLEAEGVRVFTDMPVTQVMRIQDKKWIQVGDKAIETDEIVVATGQQPNIESLNLPAVGVKYKPHHLVVNTKLQTTNRRIYACGDVIGGYPFANLANYEAKIALKNALFFPIAHVNYASVPWGIFSYPKLAQVGLTETQAKRKYFPGEIVVFRQYYKTVAAAQLHDKTTGICKIIALRTGDILGATVLGAEAEELINIIALAIAEKIKLKSLANLVPIYPSFGEIIAQAAQAWQQQRLDNNHGRQEFLEDFFLFRREWKL
jgi:pyruvate/2-oxoglutarate dehydrogenase complex dihydrolipoamide dehydrogenase (E3) component